MCKVSEIAPVMYFPFDAIAGEDVRRTPLITLDRIFEVNFRSSAAGHAGVKFC